MKSLIRAAVRRMTGYVPGEQMTVPGLIKLNTNENPYPPSPRVTRALRSLDPALLRLYPDPVCSEIRTLLATRHGVEPESIFVGNGSDEVLRLITLAFVEQGGALGMFTPSYSLYDTLAETIEAPMRKAPLGPGFGWRTPPAGFRCSVFFITTPNNPTGIMYPPEAVESFCRRFRGVAVIDEAYVDFADRHCMDLAKRLPNVLVLRTLSKSYSLAGIRLGYAVGPKELIGALMKLKDSYNVNRLTQAAAKAALEDESYMRRQAARVVRERTRLAQRLEALEFEVCPSQANFLWVRPRRIPAERLFRELRERRILIRYNPRDWHPDYVRITVGTASELNRLLAAIRAIQGQAPD